MGVNLKVLILGLFFFFNHKDDMKLVMSNGTWSFDNATIVTNVNM